jgi:hypothetical protein
MKKLLPGYKSRIAASTFNWHSMLDLNKTVSAVEATIDRFWLTTFQFPEHTGTTKRPAFNFVTISVNDIYRTNARTSMGREKLANPQILLQDFTAEHACIVMVMHVSETAVRQALGP